jgi:lambda family phage portal protein
MKSPSFFRRLASLLKANAPVLRKRWTQPEKEIVLTSFERYALESSKTDTNLKSYVDTSPRLKAVTARYEAAWWSANRTWLYSYNQDAQQDVNSWQRREVMRRVRWFEKNNWLAQKILDLIETNVVGTGVNPTPCSGDEEWNQAALAAWNRWVEYADLGGRLNFYQIEAIAARAMAVDGEVFLHLTEDPVSKRPRVQLIESHQVTSGAFEYPDNIKGSTIDADGVLVDKLTGKPEYYVVQIGDGEKARLIKAENMVHLFEPSRAGQYRGMSLFHAACNTLHDLDDLQTYEMIAAKDASEKSVIIKTASGEAPDAIIGNGQLSEMQPAQEGDKVAFYQKAFGGKNLVLQTGDEAKQFESNRPSPAMREFWEYLMRNACRAVGVSAAAVLDYEGNWGGASLRGAIVSDNRFYEVRTNALFSGLNRVWRHVIGSDIQTGFTPELKNAPAKWDCVRWQPPRRSSVDIGRDSNALINELRSGIRTYRDALGEQGGDWREILTQRANEAQFIQELATLRGIEPEQIVALDNGERNAAAVRDNQTAQQPVDKTR